ncbi:MAG TPA: 50S ribosomal protein L25 [Armatimonadota bacterium]|nr:50S ribosomal protein L25 [Armatimonadota bacterium]
MDPVALVATPRSEQGKGPCRRLRQQGLVPAILYGLGQEPVPLAVDEKVFGDIVRKRGTNLFINLEVGAIVQPVMVQSVHRHPVTLRPYSIDFLRIDITKPVHTKCEIHLVGTPKAMGVRDSIRQLMPTIEMDVLPTEATDRIELDITNLTVGDPITVASLPLPPSAKPRADLSAPVVVLHGAMAEAPAVPVAEGAAVASESQS